MILGIAALVCAVLGFFWAPSAILGGILGVLYAVYVFRPESDGGKATRSGEAGRNGKHRPVV